MSDNKKLKIRYDKVANEDLAVGFLYHELIERWGRVAFDEMIRVRLTESIRLNYAEIMHGRGVYWKINLPFISANKHGAIHFETNIRKAEIRELLGV